MAASLPENKAVFLPCGLLLRNFLQVALLNTTMVMYPELSMDEALLKFRQGYRGYKAKLDHTVINAGMQDNRFRVQCIASPTALEEDPDVSLPLRWPMHLPLLHCFYINHHFS